MYKTLFAVAFLLAAIPGWAAPAAEVTHLSGILSAKKPDGSSKVLAVRSVVEEGDVLTTEKGTYARMKFRDGGDVVLRPNTQIKVENYSFEEAKPESDGALLSIFKGGMRMVTGLIAKRNRDKISLRAPSATIGIRGTHFGALFCYQENCADVPTVSGLPPADGLHVDVSSGAITLTNAAGTAEFTAGQFGYLADGNAVPEHVPPERGIRVTMPSSIAANKGADGIGGAGALECAVQ
jgi:hypothetical protein